MIELFNLAPATSPFIPVTCQSASVDPSYWRSANSVMLLAQGYREERVDMLRGVLLITCNPVAYGTRQVGSFETRPHSSNDSVSDPRASTKLETPDFCRLRE